MSDPYQNKWDALWRSLGAQGDPLPVFQSLLAKYSETHRAYHNFAHIRQCLDELESAQKLVSDRNEVAFAIWFHDAIYDPKAKDNKEQSAHMAAGTIKAAQLPVAFSEKVTRLILATKHHAPPGDNDAALLVDVDLSILGQPHERFARYEIEIREEYAWVADDAFRKGRSAILKSFLDRATIYYTDFFRKKYEAAARENLEWSIEQLHPAG